MREHEQDGASNETEAEAEIPDARLLEATAEALAAAEAYLHAARSRLSAELRDHGAPMLTALTARQHQAHGVAWIAAYVEALRQIRGWAERLAARGALGSLERLLLLIAYGEYCAQLRGGAPMSQGEIARPEDFGFGPGEVMRGGGVDMVIRRGATSGAKQRLVDELLADRGALTAGADGLDDDAAMIREQFRRFTDDVITPHAHGWHLEDALIPMEVVRQLADLGVFGLTIPAEYDGAGMSKTAMCVVTEELSRGFLGAGSLGTRSEIAAELILRGGTEAQRAAWLPKIASGEVLPAAVFTEPDAGSDLGALRTRARRVDDGDGDGEQGYVITGAKTWITHAARADLMTVLARTDPDSADWRGLSMFLVAKTRGDAAAAFPDPTLDGGEIGVIGYRGMKEYSLAFDDHRAPADALLGGEEGKGFKQLMQTFETARIQTAARAVGVAQNALEMALRYARERRQFGAPLIAFPRVAGKIAMMAVEVMVARQLTYFSAREKDAGRRCDLEAGMAKLMGARIAWAAADNAVQIHGGVGFALEHPASRLLCDARILGIFEGAAEIQAQVIARRLLVD